MTSRRWLQWMLWVIALLSLSGCEAALMNPKGWIGQEQRSLILIAIGLMLIVVVPVIVMTVVFAWKYRSSNKAAPYLPDWAHSHRIEWVVWLVPCLIILILGTITWRTTHSLDPRQPLASSQPPLTIEVVAMDWKWLFIYPEQGIAAVNELAMPTGVPVEFKITSETVMNSFFIPQLGSQLYAMAGMENRLHLIADEPGRYHGISANYSGHGFSGMNFIALAVSAAEFEAWIAKAKGASAALEWNDYKQLAKPTQNHPVTYFSSVKPGLYHDIIAQYMGPGGHMGAAAGSTTSHAPVMHGASHSTPAGE